MRRTIRQGVFETNSSSVHSITITKSSDYNLPKSVHFGFGEYGWEHENYSSIQDKANYLWTAVCSGQACGYVLSVKEQIEKILIDHNIYCSFDMWEDTEIFNMREYPIFDGYVDHADEAEGFIKDILSDENKLLNYLFSDDSYIITGNDNSDDYDYDDYFEGETDNSWVYMKGN